MTKRTEKIRDLLQRGSSLENIEGCSERQLYRALMMLIHDGEDIVRQRACWHLGELISRMEPAKIDNLVQIAHNVEIGSDVILVSQTGIAGSSKIGKRVIAGGQVGIADHVEIGNNVILAAKTGVTKSIPANSMVAGIPHLDIRDWRKAWVSIPQLYDLLKEMKKLKKKIEQLEKK